MDGFPMLVKRKKILKRTTKSHGTFYFVKYYKCPVHNTNSGTTYQSQSGRIKCTKRGKDIVTTGTFQKPSFKALRVSDFQYLSHIIEQW